MFMCLEDDLSLIIKSLVFHSKEIFRAVQNEDSHKIEINVEILNKEVDLIKYLVENSNESISAKQFAAFEGFIFGCNNLLRRLKGIPNNTADLQNVLGDTRDTFKSKLELFIKLFKL